MINYQPKEPASVVFNGNAASVPDDALSAWDHGLFVTCADGPYVVIRDRAGARLEPRVSAAERAAADLSNKALRLLFESDHCVIRAQEAGQRPLALVWLAWREQLREVVRGNLDAIPTEPARYTSTPSPPPEPTPDAVVFEEPAPDPELETLRARITELEALVVELTPPPPSEITEPPPEVLAEAQPDETLAELKARLLFEFASLRNMLIGHIPMTEPQLLRLQALEHPKFQTWLQA